MREFKTAPFGAAVAAIVMLAVGACSSGKSAGASTTSSPSITSTASSSVTSSASTSDTGSATSATSSSLSSAGPYGTPTAACPLIPADDFARASGLDSVTGQEIPAAGSSGEVLLGCKYISGSTMAGATTIDIAQAQPGKSAQQYLSDDIASTKYNFGLSKDVPGIGDAAKFGTASCNAGTCASLWLVQIKSGMVAHLTVTLTEASGAEDPVIGLAKTLLAAVSN